jgi:hypothetical protein
MSVENRGGMMMTGEMINPPVLSGNHQGEGMGERNENLALQSTFVHTCK